jgi:hypothetical protein
VWMLCLSQATKDDLPRPMVAASQLGGPGLLDRYVLGTVLDLPVSVNTEPAPREPTV